MISSRIFFITFTLLVSILFSCNNRTEQKRSVEQHDTDLPDNTVARIDNLTISDKTLEYRIKTEKAYGNEQINEILALVMLINDGLEISVAEKNGIVASEKEIYELKQHSESTSKAPEILKKIKEAYGSDKDAYELWFLTPKIINRKLRSFFSRNQEIHKNLMNKIEIGYSLAKNGESFKSISTNNGFEYQTDTISDKPIETPEELRKYNMEEGQGVADLFIKYCKELEKGQIFDRIIDNDVSFSILRLIDKNKDSYIIETITLQKIDFDSWFRDEVSVLDIQIADEQMKVSLINQYPQLWWISSIK